MFCWGVYVWKRVTTGSTFVYSEHSIQFLYSVCRFLIPMDQVQRIDHSAKFQDFWPPKLALKYAKDSSRQSYWSWWSLLWSVKAIELQYYRDGRAFIFNSIQGLWIFRFPFCHETCSRSQLLPLTSGGFNFSLFDNWARLT